MGILKKNNKKSIFVGKTPILFGLERHLDKSSITLSTRASEHCEWRPKFEDKINLGRDIDSWVSAGSYKSFVTAYGVVLNNNGNNIVSIALKDESGKMYIYCSQSYFDQNPTHKKYINRFVRENNLSIKKDVYYCDQYELNSWIRPLEVGLDFYSEEVQDSVSVGFLNELKAKYPMPEPVEEEVLVEVVNPFTFAC